MDAVLGAGIDAELAEHALLVVERERDPLQLLAVTHRIHLDAVDRARARAGEAVEELLQLEVSEESAEPEEAAEAPESGETDEPADSESTASWEGEGEDSTDDDKGPPEPPETYESPF